TQREEGVRDTFSVIRRMDFINNNNKFEKIVKIDLRMAAINQAFDNLNLNGEVYLLNGNGDIEYATNRDIPWQRETVAYADVTLDKGIIEFETDYTGVRYL